MACEICKDKISSELKNKIGKHAPKLNRPGTRHKVIAKSGFFGFEKQLDICSICSDAIEDFGGPLLQYEHLDDDSDDPTIRLRKNEDNHSRSIFERYNSTKMQKFLKSKKRLIGKYESGQGFNYDGNKLYLDNPKYFFDNLKTIYNDIMLNCTL